MAIDLLSCYILMALQTEKQIERIREFLNKKQRTRGDSSQSYHLFRRARSFCKEVKSVTTVQNPIVLAFLSAPVNTRKRRVRRLYRLLFTKLVVDFNPCPRSFFFESLVQLRLESPVFPMR